MKSAPSVLDAPWLRVATLFGVALLVYLPVLHAGFVWNDPDYVTKPALRSLHGLWLIWFKLGSTEQYYPLLHSAFWFEHRLWGDSAPAYHLLNVLLHATSASLLWLILRRLAIPGAWLAALIFTLHPVCAESVAWISEEKNTLSTVFYLVSAWFYLRFDDERRGADYALGLAVFVLALLSKTVAATLPAALLVIFWWRRGRLDWKRDVGPLIPWLILGAGAGLFSAWVERTYVGARGSGFALTGIERILVAGRIVWFYLGKLLWPAGINFIYPHWRVNPGASGWYLYPAAAAALTIGLWLWRRRSRAPLAAWLFFVGSLFPVLGFFDVFAFIFSYVADHWQYLASIGIFVLVAAAASESMAKAAVPLRRLLQALVAGLLGLLGLVTWNECGRFHDLKTFYGTILARNPDAFMAHNNLGIELEHEGRIEEAIGHYQEAIRIQGDYADSQCNLGLALVATGRVEEAIAHYREAIRLEPRNAVVHNDLGVALGRLGRVPEAIQQYQEALRLNPAYPDPALNLGFALFRLQRLPEAIASYDRALQLEPDNAVANNDLGLVLASANRLDEAAAHYERALQLKPDYASAHCNLGAAFGALGRTDDAEKEFEAALKLNDQLPDAHYDLGAILVMKHRLPEAAAQFAAAVRGRPDFADAELQWGQVLQEMGQSDEAKPHLERAARARAASGSSAGP